MAMRNGFAAAGAAILVAACGGGGGDEGPVRDIVAEGPLAFSKAATFTVTGSQLDTSGLSLNTQGCAGLAVLPGGSPSLVQVRCTVTGASQVQVDAKNAAGELLLSRSFPVPVPEVTLQTSLGRVKLELSPDKAPNTVFNFLRYVNSGFYVGTLFHRVEPNFVVQAGGFTTGPTFKAPTANPIPLETPNGLGNLRGTVAMARNSTPNSATSQFYINLKDNPILDYASASQPGYAVFGKVSEGLAVVDTMATQPTTSRGGQNNVPQTDIVVTSAVQTR